MILRSRCKADGIALGMLEMWKEISYRPASKHLNMGHAAYKEDPIVRKGKFFESFGHVKFTVLINAQL